MPHTGEADGTTTNGDGETSGELYAEGTYNDLVEDVVDRYNRFVIRPDGGSGFLPSKPAASAMAAIIKESYPKSWTTWTEIKNDKEDGKEATYWNNYFNSFRAKCTWREKHNAAIIHSFNSRCVHRLSGILGSARNGKKCPPWISSKVWDELVVKWNSEDFKKKSARNKANRDSDKGASCHTGGSISASNHKDRMEREEDGEVEMSKVHRKLHVYEKNGKFTDDESKKLHEKHDAEMKKWEEHQETLPPEQRATRKQRKIVDDQMWIEISGGKKRGRFRGAGTQSGAWKKGPSGSYEQSSTSDGSCQSRLPDIDEMRELYQSSHEEAVQKAIETFKQSEEEKHEQRKAELAQQQALMDQKMQQIAKEREQMQAQMQDMQVLQQMMMHQQQQQQLPLAFNNYQSSHYQQSLTFVPQSSSEYQNAQQSASFPQQTMFRSMPNILPSSTPLTAPLSDALIEKTAQRFIFDDDVNEDPNNIPHNNNRGI
ncbi:hypothetical protein QL285_018411 [Trifolium repens]|nr:hypothetical protein QL285_018411 [Trifolium repens]